LAEKIAGTPVAGGGSLQTVTATVPMLGFVKRTEVRTVVASPAKDNTEKDVLAFLDQDYYRHDIARAMATGFVQMDMSEGMNQIRVRREDVPKTASRPYLAPREPSMQREKQCSINLSRLMTVFREYIARFVHV